MEIREPSVIAKLPRLQIEDGRYQFSQVYSIKGGIKRRRQEICAAADGDSVNIYEIHSGRIITSCAVPPDTVFTCAPSAIRAQTTEGRATKNIYYVSKRRGEAVLSLFSDGTGDIHRRALAKTVALDDKSPVIQLDVLATSGSFELLVVREDGSFEVYDDKLSSRLRQGKFVNDARNSRFLAAQWLSSTQALKSVLKARPDISAVSESGSSFVLGVLEDHEKESSDSSAVDLGIWQVPTSPSTVSNSAELSPILYHKILASARLVSKEPTSIVFSEKTTRLTIKTDSRTYTYDLTAMVPRVVSESPATVSDQISSIQVSDTLSLSSTPHSLQIHNALFGTLQSRLNLATSGLKRKRPNSQIGPILFIAYFRQPNRVLALRRGHLTAVDLRDSTGPGFSKAVKHTSLLISNIGRGVQSNGRQDQASKSGGGGSPGNTQNRIEQSAEWQQTAKQLVYCCQNQDLVGFEKLLLEQEETESSIRPRRPHVMPEWKANFVISKMFKLDENTQDGLDEKGTQVKLILPTRKVLEVLALQGLLTVERISRVLKIASNPDAENVRPDQVSQALVDCDPSMSLLGKYLKQAPYIPQHELCATIQKLLRQALATAQSQAEPPSTDENGRQSLPNGSLSLAQDAIPQSKGSLPSITACLCTAIQRLSETAEGFLPAFIRASFQQSDTIALIQFLRQQLFRGGYTRSLQAQRYPSPPISESGAGTDEAKVDNGSREITLSAIAATLSDCIDAIGPVGVLGLGDNEQFVQTLIPELSSEISRATEALQDATFLQGVLRETLRFAESTIGNHDSSAAILGVNGADAQQKKPGSITTLYSEPVNEGSVVSGLAALPLGLRAEGKIQPYKVRKGDGKVAKRSEREMGMLQDRLRGPYALERLTL